MFSVRLCFSLSFSLFLTKDLLSLNAMERTQYNIDDCICTHKIMQKQIGVIKDKKFDLAKALESDRINWEAHAREQHALAASRKELLKRCKEDMEISVRDFEKSINPWLEAAGYHPVTQTPIAMKKLIEEIAEELSDD